MPQLNLLNMATLTLLALALFAGLACSTPVSRIAGGTPANIAQFPSIVQVEFLGTSSFIWTQTCGAGILTARYVLSAAHCFHGIFYEPKNRRIRAGSSIRSYGGQVSYVDVEINHPTYGVNDMDGDISLVRLLTPLNYTTYVQPGYVIEHGFQMPAGVSVDIAGWGATEIGGLPSNELREATVYIVDRRICAERYSALTNSRAVTENMICANLLDVGGKDACHGDLGGPLYYGQIFVGILSWGEGCANSTLPGVSTAVSSYTNWIIDAAV